MKPADTRIPLGIRVKLSDREQWAKYMAVCEAAVLAISTAQAPWSVIPPTCKLMIHVCDRRADGLKMRYPAAGGVSAPVFV